MSSQAPSNAGTCGYCGRAQTRAPPQYLDLDPLCIHELPPHPELSSSKEKFDRTLAEFLSSVLIEAYEIDFDDGSWTEHGPFPAKGNRVVVTMPSLSTAQAGQNIDVTVAAEKRARGSGSSAWLGRRSYHSALEVEYPELDALLAQDHCRKEAEYTPSIFDGHELLRWDAEDLKKAVAQLKPEWKVTNIQMSVYQMFHEMPKILGVSMLKNRVFQVLCITAHSKYDAPSPGEPITQSQSHTVQLPIDVKTFRDIPTVMSKSRIRAQSLAYNNTDDAASQGEKAKRKLKNNGKGLTEGVYASVERLRQAPTAAAQDGGMHRWDMITRSDAKGITRAAPTGTKNKEILDAVAEDVKYVLEQIAKQRRAK